MPWKSGMSCERNLGRLTSLIERRTNTFSSSSGNSRLSEPAALLRAERVGLHNLAGQRPRLREAIRHQRDLAYHGVVRHHHRTWPEERLEVVGQLRSAGIAGVHPREALGRGALDGQDLLGNDRKHLEVDPVELVEAGPRASGGKALKELAHREVVEAIGAVENDALFGERLGQVFGRLRLAGSGRTLGRAAQVELQRAHERAVAAVGERGDHQPERVAQLRDPVEVVELVDAGLDHGCEHVTAVYVHRHHRAERRTLQLGQLRTHQLDDVFELRSALCLILTGALEPLVLDERLRLPRPVDLIDGQHDHPRPFNAPVDPFAPSVGRFGLLHDA
eukprot:scaffold10193_cov107-Isochrysis_galbana.AAC.3